MFCRNLIEHLVDVLSILLRANKAHRSNIRVLHYKAQMLNVFVGKRIERQVGVRQVDAFMRRQGLSVRLGALDTQAGIDVAILA